MPLKNESSNALINAYYCFSLLCAHALKSYFNYWTTIF